MRIMKNVSQAKVDAGIEAFSDKDLSAILHSVGHEQIDKRRPCLNKNSQPIDPWSRVLASLRGDSGCDMAGKSDQLHLGRLRHTPSIGNHTRSPRACTITVVEKLSSSLVTLSWRDPTRCSYQEQLWHSATARRSGQCALSGVRIQRGDAIFRPRSRGQSTPMNNDAMILATALGQAANP